MWTSPAARWITRLKNVAEAEDQIDLTRTGTSAPDVIDRLNLKRAIRQLPDGHRRFFLLHDVLGYQHAEIAVLLGCSTGCSKSQLHKARKSLRRLLWAARIARAFREKPRDRLRPLATSAT